MKAPMLTKEYFDLYKDQMAPKVKTLGALNGKGCKKAFTTRVPPFVREGDNAYLVIKNHKERWFYTPMEVHMTPAGNRLIIKSNPIVIWSGYLLHDNKIYRASAYDLYCGIIPTDMEIPLSEVEA